MRFEGPCHIWEDETKASKLKAKKWMDKENERLQPIRKQEWELATGMR